MEQIQSPAEVFDAVFGRGNGRQRARAREAGRQVPADPMREIAIPRYGYTWQQVYWWPISAGLWVVMWLNTVALMLYGLAYVTRDLTVATGELSVRQLGVWAHHAGLDAGDLLAGQFSSVVGPPGPASAATLAAGAFLCRQVVRAVSSSRAPRRSLWVPGPVAVAPEIDTDELAGRRQKRAVTIAGVQAALAQLDAEWLSYEMDLDAYYLTKPLLRDPAVEQTAAYRSALYELRTLAERLGKSSTDAELDEAEQAAEAALMAWGEANDHALAIGLSDRSPTERAALRRLHALTAQLADPSTPKPMWPSLIGAITREMSKLTTVPASWDHLSRVPALEQRNPAAIAAADSE